MELAPAGLREPWPARAAGGPARTATRRSATPATSPIEPGFRPDDDPRAKNLDLICEFLPRERSLVDGALGGGGADARLLVLGGDCTAHAGAMAGLRAGVPGRPLAIAWFDAHGDFNTPDTTPSGNVWGMPFAMICGRGDPDLVEACDGPTVFEEDAALIGGQVLDESESRALAASQVAHFGAGMIGTASGLAALGAWARVVGEQRRRDLHRDRHGLPRRERRLGGHDARAGRPVAGDDARRPCRALAAELPVVGFGATGVTLANGDAEATADAIAALAAAAFSGR